MKDGKDTIIVLPQFQIDGMLEIMDYILTHPGTTVEKVKTKFDLNESEYGMIFDLCMPHERNRSNERYWITKYKGLLCALEEVVGYAKDKSMKTIPVNKIEAIMKRHGVGIKNNAYQEAFDTCDVPEEGLVIDEAELNKHGLYLRKEEDEA